MRVSSAQPLKVFVALLSFFFVSNLQTLVTENTSGIQHYHQYIVAIVICILLGAFTKMIIQADRASYLYISWYATFIGVCAVSLLIVKNDQAAIDQFINYSWFAGLSCAFLLVIQRPDLMKAAGLGVLAASLVKAGISLFEFFNPDLVLLGSTEDVAGTIGRSPGLHYDPNRNGHALVLSMFVAQFFIPRHLRLPFALLIGAAVLCTFSRSSMLAWGLAVVFSTLLGYHGSGSYILKSVALALVGAAGYIIASGMAPQLIIDWGLAEFVNENMMDRLTGSLFGQEDESNVARIEIAQAGWQMYASNPWTGAGLGATAQLLDTGAIVYGGVHNTLLDIAAELGTLGAITFLCLGLLPFLTNSSSCLLFALLYFFTAMFAHTQLEEAFIAILLPMGVLHLNRHQNRSGRSRRRRRRRRSR